MMIFSPGLFLPRTSPGDNDETINNPVVGYDNQVTIATLAADTADANHPASNLANPNTASYWLAANTTTQYITELTDNTRLVDYLAIAKHNLLTAGITVSVETQIALAGAWTSVTTPQVLADNGPTIFRFTPGLYTGVRLKLLTGGSAPAQIAVMYIGLLLTIARRLYVGHSPLALSRQATVTNGKSESGNFLGRIVTGEVTNSSAAFANIDPARYRSRIDPFVKASKDTPFFWAWRPGDYPLETGFAWMTNSPVPSNTGMNGMMSIQFQFEGIST